VLLDFANHEPVLVYFEPDRVTVPAEVCGTDSDEETGVWVPVTQCAIAAANQLPDGALNENVITLDPPCSSCGRRSTMSRWGPDATGATGWQCHAMDCLQDTEDGVFE